jgi:hypothetical protein
MAPAGARVLVRASAGTRAGTAGFPAGVADLGYTSAPMSAVLPPGGCGIPRELALDPAAFEKLLLAAWVIQCESDRLSQDRKVFDGSEIHREPIPIVSHSSLDPATLPVGPKLPPMAPVCIDLTAKLPPARVEETGTPATSGTLALVPEICVGPTSHALLDSDIELDDSSPAETLVPGSRRKTGLTLVWKNGQSPAEARTVHFLRSAPAASVLAGILLLGGITVGLTFGLMHPDSVLPWLPVFASYSKPEGIATGRGSGESAPPLLESSHLKVTDPSISSGLEQLSRFEIRTLRRQAEYGDESAALTLGMAYESGQTLPQSCTQAAHWVRIAAEDGDPAAQYNLALRYIYGDGTPVNYIEAMRLLQQSARQGYASAQAALQHLQF